jgi:hypothetical protein
MNLTCPCCHAKFPLDAALEGDAAGELLAVFTQAGPLSRPLLAYLGLFRSKARALSFDRAVRLAREVLDLGADPRALAVALGETVEALRSKRDQGQSKPLSNHNYLKRVLESTLPAAPANVGATHASPALVVAKGKRAQGIAALADWGQTDWLRALIADGLSALLAGGYDGAPGADTITLTADVWHHVLATGCNSETLDATRVKQGFSGLLKTAQKWPEPKAMFAQMPARIRREKLDAPPPSANQVAEGKRFFADMAAVIGNGMGIPGGATVNEEDRRQQLQEQSRKLNEGRS